jgi:hypothetical protein
MTPTILAQPPSLWEKFVMAVDDITLRLNRITKALTDASVPYALVGGQAVALWVASKDQSAVRITKDVDILLSRKDLPRARAAALSVDMDYCEIVGVGMFLDRSNPNPRHAVHIVWAGEKVRPENLIEAPQIHSSEAIEPGKQVVSLLNLVVMKLVSNRDQDRVHLRDMIEVGLVGREILVKVPEPIRATLEALLVELGR